MRVYAASRLAAPGIDAATATLANHSQVADTHVCPALPASAGGNPVPEARAAALLSVRCAGMIGDG